MLTANDWPVGRQSSTVVYSQTIAFCFDYNYSTFFPIKDVAVVGLNDFTQIVGSDLGAGGLAGHEGRVMIPQR